MATKKNKRRARAIGAPARRYLSISPDRTMALAEQFARSLPPGAVVLLEGPLGAGKTVFVRGMARALGVDDSRVHSPSFLLIHDYGGLVHIDGYRIRQAGEEVLRETGLWEALEGEGIKAVEWPPAVVKRRFRRALRVRLRFADGDRRIIELPNLR